MNSLIPLRWASPFVIQMISDLDVNFSVFSYLYPLRDSLAPVYTASELDPDVSLC